MLCPHTNLKKKKISLSNLNTNQRYTTPKSCTENMQSLWILSVAWKSSMFMDFPLNANWFQVEYSDFKNLCKGNPCVRTSACWCSKSPNIIHLCVWFSHTQPKGGIESHIRTLKCCMTICNIMGFSTHCLSVCGTTCPIRQRCWISLSFFQVSCPK